MGEGTTYGLPADANVFTNGPAEFGTPLAAGNRISFRASNGQMLIDAETPDATGGRAIVPLQGTGNLGTQQPTGDTIYDISDPAGTPAGNNCQMNLDPSKLPGGSKVTILARNSGQLELSDADGHQFVGAGFSEGSLPIGAVASMVFDSARGIWLVIE